MRVVDLAKELEVPPSEVLQVCQRVGIEAAWAGAELGNSDVLVLRAELANSDAPLDLTEPKEPVVPAIEPTEPVAEPVVDPVGPAAVPSFEAGEEADPPTGSPAAAEPTMEPVPSVDVPLPPTSAASMPGLIDEITPDEQVATPGPLNMGRPVSAATLLVNDEARRASVIATHKGHTFDHGVRTSAIALVLAVAAAVGSSFFRNPWPVGLLWLLGLVLLIGSLVAAGRAWYRCSTHPERRRGRGLAIGLVLLGVVAAGVAGLGVWTVVRTEPAHDAPLGLGRHQAIQQARWGYKRFQLVRHTSWELPAKDTGSCWSDVADDTGKVDRRRAERVEFGQDLKTCSNPHDVEVLAVWPIDKLPDAPFPGKAALQSDAASRCAAELKAANAAAARRKQPTSPAQLQIEYPTASGWTAGDHDVACVAVLHRSGRIDGSDARKGS